MRKNITQWWQKRHPSTQSLATHLWRAITNFNRHGARQAAALAYYAIFSLFPLTLLLAVGIGSILSTEIASQQIGNALRLFLPTGTASPLESDVIAALDQSRSFGLIALLGLAWSALGLFTNITTSLDLIFQVPASRSMWRQRLVAFLMTIMLIILIIASFVTSGVLQVISAFLGSQPNLWISIMRFFLPMGLDMVIFALLFRFVPTRRPYWDAVFPAAIFGAAGWELAKNIFAWYTTNLANFQVIYGTISTVIALLFYAYIIASIFLLSAEICAQLNSWMTAQHIHEQPAPSPVAMSSENQQN